MSAELNEIRAELNRIGRVIRVLDVAVYVLAGLMAVNVGVVATVWWLS